LAEQVLLHHCTVRELSAVQKRLSFYETQGETMKQYRLFALAAVAAMFLAVSVPAARAQISVGVQIGAPPVCPYGYFDYPPYDCAPFGYYGPSWFNGGIFLGAGPWFRGPEGFHGWVNRRYDPHYGYRGPLPRRGEHPDWDRHRGWEQHYHGDYQRQEYRHDNGNHYGQERDHHDNGYHNGEDRGRDAHDNAHAHGNDNAHGRDNGHGNDNGHHHDDDHH
jgi:hypothetical protein